MWQLDWAAQPPREVSPSPLPGNHFEGVEHTNPTQVGGLMWEEHCHECAEPDCYRTCPLYVRRGDGRCARLEYGIYPNASFAGLFPFGADVKFRRWGKLESVIPVRRLPTQTARRLTRIDRALVPTLRGVDRIRGWPEHNQLTAAYRSARIKGLRAAPSRDFDDFLIEAWSPETESFRLVIECKGGGSSYFRESVTIEPGWNWMRLSAAPLLVGATDRSSRILVYPENDATVRAIFTWLDFVAYAREESGTNDPVVTEPDVARRPADKIKCVVWDLDNTLWDGILADVGPDALALVPEVRDVIDRLDERGIVQSVASKNNHGEAWGVITQLGLSEMFLYPAINWGAKSANIRSIADALNIGLDSVAFIDDSPVERAEVATALPEVRVYAEGSLGELLDLEEFNVRPSSEGRSRRLSYLAEEKRQAVFASASDSAIEDFLRSCAIEVELSTPSDVMTLDRCHELLMRSNQLNLTTRRYSRDELEALVIDPFQAAVAVQVRDRFGNYGLVGFLTFRASDDGLVVVEDLVLSCRVAKKYIENAVLEAVRTVVAAEAPAIEMTFMPTPRNGALLEALRTLGLGDAVSPPGEPTMLRLATDQALPFSDVATVTDVQSEVRDRLIAMLRSRPKRSSASQGSVTR